MVQKLKEFSWPADWKTEFVQVTKRVYAYVQAIERVGRIGISNAGLIVGEKRAAVVDTLTTAAMTRAFLKEVKGVTKNEITYLINTHHHPDHTLTNHIIPEAITIGQNNCRMMIQRWIKAGQPSLKLLSADNPNWDHSESHLTPTDVTFENNLTILLDDLEMRLLYFGVAHSNSDIVIHIPEESVVFVGDLVFPELPRRREAGSYLNWTKVLPKIADLNAKFYIPGHGKVLNKDGVLQCQGVLQTYYDEGKAAHDAGLPAAEAVNRMKSGYFKKLIELDPKWFVKLVETLYQEIEQKKA
jgi:cyclase